MDIELRQLKYLLAVVEEANFTRAAEKVFISQSALSQQIQALEQAVGTILLDRSRRGIRPTEAGEVLVHHARRIFLELDQAETLLNELDGLLRGELHIGVVQTVNEYFMPEIIARFTQTYPQVRILVEELSSDDIEHGLETGALHVGLSFLPTNHPNLETAPLFQETLALIVRRDHPLAAQSAVPVASLHEMPMVMLSKTFCTRRVWEESAQLTSAQPQVVIEMNTVSSILAAVERCNLATVLPKHTLQQAQAPELVGIDLCSPTPTREVGIIWHGDYFLCAATRAFTTMAREISHQFKLEAR